MLPSVTNKQQKTKHLKKEEKKAEFLLLISAAAAYLVFSVGNCGEACFLYK